MKIARQDWPQLLSLMDQALDLPTRARRGWLEGLAEPEPVKDSLRGLLDARRAIETDDFLGELPVHAPREPHACTCPLQAGAAVGPWRLVRELGRGGMSSVWLAERADAQLHRQVALKLPHAGPGQELLAQRLLRERDILAGLAHPHIARLYDVGLADAGMPYMVMEYVPGRTLLAHADALRLGVPERLTLFQQVLAAVQYAHGRLVLHRDLKPGNILVSEDGEVKLLDFGIAKLLADDGAAPQATELTRAAGRPLTPEYASPEQLLDQPLGTASDVYSLGAVLYELLCGVRPHALAGLTAAQREAAVVQGDVRAPSRRAAADTGAQALAARRSTAAELKRALAGDLDAVVLKALAREPAQRYATVEAFAKDVSRVLSGRPVSAQAPTVGYHLVKFVRRHRLAVGLGSLAVAALIAAGAVAVVQGLVAQREAAKALAVRDFMVDVFRDANPELSQGREPTGRELLRRSRERLLAAAATPAGAALPVNDLLEGLADAQFKMGDYAAADATLGLWLERNAAAMGDDSRIRGLLARAMATLNLRQLEASRALLNQAEPLIQRSGEAAHRREYERLRGHVALHSLDLDSADQHFQAYFADAAALGADLPDRVLGAHLAAANIRNLQGRQVEAFRLLDVARAYADSHADVLADASFRYVAEFRATFELTAGDYRTVSTWLPQTVQKCDEQLGPDSESCRTLKDLLVRPLLKMGLVEEALTPARDLARWAELDDALAGRVRAAASAARALAMARQSEGLVQMTRVLEAAAQPSVGDRSAEMEQAVVRLQAINTLAELRLLDRDPGTALRWLAEGRALDRAQPENANAAERRKTRLFEGIARQMQGRHAEALHTLGSYCDQNALSAGSLPVLQRHFSLNCVTSLAAQGRTAEARAIVERALPVLGRAYGATSPTVLRARQLRAQVMAFQFADANSLPAPLPSVGFFN